MALSSSSTLTDALNQYKDNLAWEGNTTKAANALEAVRFILASRPKVIASADRNINFESLLAEKQQLEQYLRHNSASVNRSTFTRGRMLT